MVADIYQPHTCRSQWTCSLAWLKEYCAASGLGSSHSAPSSIFHIIIMKTVTCSGGGKLKLACEECGWMGYGISQMYHAKFDHSQEWLLFARTDSSCYSSIHKFPNQLWNSSVSSWSQLRITLHTIRTVKPGVRGDPNLNSGKPLEWSKRHKSMNERRCIFPMALSHC